MSKLPPRKPGFKPDLNRIDAAHQYVQRAVRSPREARVLELIAFMELVEGRSITRAQAEQWLKPE